MAKDAELDDETALKIGDREVAHRADGIVGSSVVPMMTGPNTAARA